MKRAIILSRHYWKPSHSAGSSQVYEECTLFNLSDLQFEKELSKMNASFRTSTLSVKHDFNLSKKSDQKEFLKYCIDCYYQPYIYNHEAASIGKSIVESQRETFPYFK